MLEQAKLAGVTMRMDPIDISPSPVLHDKSNNIQTGKPEGFLIGNEDREVRYLDGRNTTQREMLVDGMSYTDTTQFIRYTPRDQLPHSDQPGREKDIMTNVTGSVDMPAYLQWLRTHGYELSLLQIQ